MQSHNLPPYELHFKIYINGRHVCKLYFQILYQCCHSYHDPVCSFSQVGHAVAMCNWMLSLNARRYECVVVVVVVISLCV